jgi:hypothetical protein
MIILKLGDTLQRGDEVYTWIDPECSEINWIEICPCQEGNLIDENHVTRNEWEWETDFYGCDDADFITIGKKVVDSDF